VCAEPIQPGRTERETVATIGQIIRKGFTFADLVRGARRPDELISETT